MLKELDRLEVAQARKYTDFDDIKRRVYILLNKLGYIPFCCEKMLDD